MIVRIDSFGRIYLRLQRGILMTDIRIHVVYTLLAVEDIDKCPSFMLMFDGHGFL